MVAKSERSERARALAELIEQGGGVARRSSLNLSATSRDLVPDIGAGEIPAFRATPGRTAERPLSSVAAGINPVVHDRASDDGAGRRGNPQHGAGAVDAGKPVIKDAGKAGGPPRDGDGSTTESSGEAPMDRERARQIISSIFTMTEEEFLAQDDSNTIGGHTLGQIQQAFGIRAAEIFEERGVEHNQFGRQSISKKTPEVEAEIQRHDDGIYGVSLHLWLNEARPAGSVRHPRLLAYSRLPLTNEQHNLMNYTHKATADHTTEEYTGHPDRDSAADDNNVGFFRGVWLLATNLTDWGEPDMALPRNSHPLPPEEDPMEVIAREAARVIRRDPRVFGEDLAVGQDGDRLAFLEEPLGQRINERGGNAPARDREHPQEGELRRFDRAVELGAYEEHLPELEERLEALLSNAPEIDRSISDPNRLLVLTNGEIGRLWGLFPETARNRAVPAQIQGFGSIWFTDISRIPLPFSTSPDNAVTPTTFAFGATQDTLDENNRVNGTNIFLCQIPENIGFSREAKRIAQAKVAVHEQSHSIINAEVVNNTMLRLPSGEEISAREFRARFAEVALRNGPISHYSASYRENGDFIGDDSGWDISVGEELGESIAAYVLGFAVSSQGDLTFNPFDGREEVRNLIHDYLHAQRVI